MAKTHILVIDDEKEIQKLFSSYLTAFDYQISTAGSIKEARHFLLEEHFDLVILDIILQDGNGMEVLETIHMETPHLPVIIVTGLGYNDEVVREAMENGAAGFVAKALRMDQLLMEIRRVLKYQHPGSSAVRQLN